LAINRARDAHHCARAAQIAASPRRRAAIQTFTDQHNAGPMPFRWAKPADDILASIEHICNRNKPVAAE
jgi:hypothetical protein